MMSYYRELERVCYGPPPQKLYASMFIALSQYHHSLGESSEQEEQIDPVQNMLELWDNYYRQYWNDIQILDMQIYAAVIRTLSHQHPSPQPDQVHHFFQLLS